MYQYSDEKIKRLIEGAVERNTELDCIEFKDARGGLPGDLWRPITAFSNTPTGGLIVFGVEESKVSRAIKIVGGLDLHRIQEKIAEYMRDKVRNCGEYSIKVLDIRGAPLIILVLSEVQKENKPCYNVDLGMHKGACIRIGNTNRLITEEELRAFLRYTPEYRYDRKVVKSSTLSMLSDEKIKLLIEKSAERTGRSVPDVQVKEKVLKNLGIIAETSNGAFIPTIAGCLMFSKGNPQEILGLERYTTRCVRYAGKSPSTSIVTQQELYGTLDMQIEESLMFIKRTINYGAKIVGAKRVEQYEYPEDALREVVANAIIHRDYIITGTYTKIAVFSDRIEISNAGTLPPGITIDNIKDSQYSRNEIIANIMRVLDYMEEFGRGIDLVYARMAEYGLVEPLFKNSSNTFKVTLLGALYKGLNERQIKIWNYLQENNKANINDFFSNLFQGVGRSTINVDLKKMVEMELIALKGSSNSTYYEPKY